MTRAHSARAAVAACCWLLPVAAFAQPATGTVSPFNGSGAPGTQQSITVTASDPGGWQNVYHLDLVINSVASGTNACFLVYYPSVNSIYLMNDNVSGWAGNVDLNNHTGSASSSHCTIYGSGSSVSSQGGALSLTFNVSFTFTGGTLYYWEQLIENGGASSGWWQIVNGSGNPASFQILSANQPPSVGTVSPQYETIAANTATILQFTGSDPNGSQDVAEMDVVINSVPDGSSGCFWVFFPYSNAVYLVQNTSPWTWQPVGVNGNPSYPYASSSAECTVSPSGSTASGSGVTETLNLNLSFPSSFVGTKYYWQQIKDQSNATSNWQQIAGSVTVNPPSASVQLTVTGENGTVFQIGDTFTVSITGRPYQAVTVSQNGGPISGPVGYTDGQGNWSISGTWGAGDVGAYTQTWYVAGVAAIPGLAFQVVTSLLQCTTGLTQRYLNSYQQSGVGTFVQLTVQGVSATSGVTVAGVDILVWNETQSAANATVISASPSGSNWVATLVLPSQFSTNLGSSTVAARVRGSNQRTLMCPNPAFFAILKQAGFPPAAPRTSCSTLGGTWTDATAGSPALTWTLTQSGTAIAGQVVREPFSGCPSVTWQNVSGSGPTNGNFTVNASNPDLPGSGSCTATQQFTETLSTSNSVCDQATGTYYNPGTGASGPVSWSSSPAIPTGETSQLRNASSPWDTNGYSTEARFKGVLAALSNGTTFSGRQVRETAQSLNDGCNQITGTADSVFPVTSTDISASWYLQNDGTYGDDLIGYGPAIARYYQTYAGSGNCSLQLQQGMQINVDSSGWQTYATNSVTIAVQPTQISVTRNGTTATKAPYPVQ
jgi:hypothetical protein